MQLKRTEPTSSIHKANDKISDWQLGRISPMPSQVPSGWELVRLTSVAKLESGHTPSRRKPEYWNGDIPWISLHDSTALDVPAIHYTAQTISKLGLENRGVAGLVGIEGGVVSGVFNLESSGVEASDWRPRHDERYHEA
jgi:hypothetical protein